MIDPSSLDPPRQPGIAVRLEAMAAKLSPLQEKVLLTLLGTLYVMGGYFLVGLATPAARATSLATWLDAAIPFRPGGIFAYGWVYTIAFYPAFCVRSRCLFRRIVAAYVSGASIALTCFALYPVTAVHLRPDLSGLDRASFAVWALEMLYAYDPPVNLFPSLHVLMAALVVCAAWRARPLWGLLALVPAVSIGVAIVIVKQHFVADGLAALLVAWGVNRAWLRSWQPAAGDVAASSWRGPLAYGLTHGAVYGALYLAFISGWAPWRH